MITGSLQVKNDKYYAVLNLKVNGTRKPKWIPTNLEVKGNKRKADQELLRLIAEYSEKEAQQANYLEAEMPFMEYLAYWLKMIRPTIATATHQSYKNMVEGRIRRYFEKHTVTLGEVTPNLLQNFYQEILDEGYTANTVIHYHAVLRKSLQNAVKKDMILRNPADRVDKPRKNQYRAAHYSEEEMLQLFQVIEGDSLELAVKVAAYYGLRRSEVLGIKWDAINFKDKTLSIQHKIIEVEIDGQYLPMGEDVMKTKSSVRTLPLLPPVEELFLREKEKQETFRRLFRKAYCQDYLDYVCVDEMGNLLRPNFVTEHFAFIIKKYGLKKIRFHDLRHTCASLLLANGVPMKQIQIWLGHSTFSTTADVYAHLDVSAQLRTGEVAGVFFEKPDNAKEAIV